MLTSPVVPLIVTSPFGPRPRIGLDGRPGPLHPGVDLRASIGQEVYAAATGEIVESRLSSNNPPDWRPGPPPADWPKDETGKPMRYPLAMGYGNLVMIAHYDGSVTLYAHMAQRFVVVGDHVQAGMVIGYAGSTGYSYGPHLHFELRVPHGDLMPGPVDPLPHLPPASPA